MDKKFFSGKKILIMGLGRFGGGVDSAKFAAACGAKVTVTDLASAEQLADSVEQLKDFPEIEFHLGGHEKKDFEQSDIIIANPAVPPDNEFIEIAHRNNRLITSQMEIFFELCPASIVGITGSVGKSTTAALAAHLLNAAAPKITSHGSLHRTPNGGLTCHEKVWLSGNIGNEPLLGLLEQISSVDLVVLELSSFQIEQLARIKKAPQFALLTNLTPNHLDRYGIFDAYCSAKENIFKYQKLKENKPAVSIFNAEDRIAAEWFEKYSSDIGRECIRFSVTALEEEIKEHFSLPGRANLSNLSAAVAVAKYFGLDNEIIKNSLHDFKPLAHRLEFVAEINGVKWYNDSKATTAEGAIAALQAFEQPKIIIAGGYDKNVFFDELGKTIAQSCKAAILIGQTAQKIAQSIRNAKMSLRAKRSNLNGRDTGYEIRDTKIEFAKSLADAVKLAHSIAATGDVVLLSPACASFDMFQNYAHRGNEFTRLVHCIRKK